LNNFAISSDGIAEGLKRSASTLVAAGNSLEQSIAMFAAGNKVAQDPEALGNALKVLSMRIRGTKTELEEAGEETDGLITNTSKLRDKVKALTNVNGNGGVDILTNTGAYRSTYDILLDIAEVWDDINDANPKNQAALLEILAGKTRGSQLAAILQNPEDLRDSYEMALDSDGSALKELDTYLNSIQGKMQQFTNSVQTMWNNMLDSETVKGFVKLGTTLVSLADKVGVINILFSVLTTMLMRKAGISSIGDFFSKTVVSADQAKEKIKELQTEYDRLGTSASKENIRKQKQIKQQMAPYEAIVDNVDKLKLAQDKLTRLQSNLNVARKNNLPTEYIEKYQKEIKETEAEIQRLEIANKKLGTSGQIAWANLKVGAKAFAKQLQQTLTSMATMFLISKVIEGITWLFDKLIETAEESKDKFDNLVSELDSTKSGLDDLESKLEDINKQIEEISENTPLSFTDEEDLKRLKAESAELEQQIKFQKMIADQQQAKVNQEAVKQVGKYKQTVGSSGKTSGEIMGESIGAGAAIGTAAGLTTLGTAIGTALVGAIKGGATGAAAGPWGIVAGALIGLVLGVAGGAIAGGIQVANEGSTVGATLENMEENYDDLAQKMVDARDKALKTGSEEDQEAYKKAQENFTNFKANVANYFTEMGTYFDNMDMEKATESEKAAYEEYKNLQDKWAIINNGDDAKTNALDRLFGEDASELVRFYRDKIKTDIENGESVDFQEMIDVTGLGDDLETLGITTKDVSDYFTQLGEAGADAVKEIDFSDVVSELAKLESYLGSVQSIIEEFKTEGVVSASTLDGLDEKIKGLESFDEYAEVLMSGTATMADVKFATEKLAAELLDSVDNLSNDNKLTYIALLENAGVENAKELVESYIQQDFFDINNIKSATTEFCKLSDQIAGAANEYNNIIEQDETWSKGNVDYSKRPIVSAETMQEKYPEFDSDDDATTYDMDKAILDSEGNTAYTVKVTPILEDGTVIDEKTLTEYVEGVLQDAYNKGGLEGVLEADKNGYNIVIATTTEKVEYDDNGYSVLDKALQGAKDTHLELVNMSAQGLIDLAAENDIVLELADAYKILQAAENARAKQAKRDSEVLAKATAEYNNKKKQEIADSLRTDEKYKSFQYLFATLDGLKNGSSWYKGYTPEAREAAIKSTTDELEKYLKKYGYTLADAFPTLEVVPEITVSQSDVDAANKELQYLLNKTKPTVTPEIDLDPRNQIENMADWEEAIKSLSGVYNELLDDDKVSAGSLVGLADTFDIVGAKEEYEEFVKILSTAKADTPEVRDAFENLTAAYLANSGALEDVTEETEAMTVAKLKEMGVVNAEAVAHKALLINQMQHIASIERLKTATDEQIESDAQAMATLAAEAGVALTTADAINTLKYYRELYNIEDITSVTADEANSLLALATSAGIAIEELVKLEKVRDFIANKDQMKSDFFKSKNPGNQYVYASMAKLWDEEFEKTYSEQLKQLYAGVGTEYTPPNFEEIIRNSLGGLDFSGLFGDAVNGGSDYGNKLDWLDYYFTKIENKIKEKEADLENVMSADVNGLSKKNTLIDEIIGLYKSKETPLKTAMKAYTDRADELFNSFSKDIQDKILNGSIDINSDLYDSKYDKDITKKIQDYFNYITKASDLEIELEGIKVKVADFSLQKFEDTSKAFDNEIEEKFQSDQDLIETEISYLEEQGNRVDPKLYENLIKIQKEEQAVLENKKKTLENILATEMAAGRIHKGDDQWYKMTDTINDVDEAIIKGKNDIEKFQNKINEIYWDNFKKLIDQIDDVNSELSSLFELLSDDDKVVDKLGNWTNEGIASIGLLAQQMENAKQKSKEYKQAIADLEKNKANYSIDEYNEKMAELKENYLSELKNVEELKDKIVNLNKVRVDSAKKAIDEEIKALEEKNKKLKEELSLEKEQYDWQKKVAEKEKSIADIQRRLNALAGDNSASAIAERRKLQAELAEAQQEMDDMWYEHGIEEQQKNLDESLENYKKNKEDEKEALDKWLEDEEKVIQASFDLFNSNVDLVSSVLTAFEQEHGIELTKAITDPWKSGIDAMTAYREALEKMKQDQEDAKNDADDTADDIIESLNEPETTTPAPEPTDTPKPDDAPKPDDKPKSPSVGETVTVRKDATNWSRDGGNGTRMASWVPGSSFTVSRKDGDEVLLERNKVAIGWIKQNKLEGYYKGTTGVKDGQWAFTDELGDELTLHAGPNGRLQYLTKGSGVVTADLTKRLMEWGELDPSQVLKNSAPKLGAPQITTNNMEISLSINEVVHIDHADSNSIQDITSAVQKQMDQYMKNVNQSLKRFTR
jgi:DNA repair exonuclease SbcCD ATPase subunit